MIYSRPEYPRPQFRRDEWTPLNGEWEFDYDDAADGVKRGLCGGKVALSRKITVPFCYEYEASGIGEQARHNTVWYRRIFNIDKKLSGSRALLCFNGADCVTDVWINGKHAVTHKGAYSPFDVDITELVKSGDNVIVVRCFDPDDPTIPRGKQSWTGKKFSCFYVPSTGIWQSVWIEYFDADCIDGFTVTPDIDTLSFSGELTTRYGIADAVELDVSFDGKRVKKVRFSLDGKHTRYSVGLMENDFVDEVTYWTPDSPKLYYIDLTLYKGEAKVDTAHTRFGMRKISIDEHGQITLNNRRLYQRLILDQGYWRVSGTTPPSAEALKSDIAAAKAMGFNGARKHQKLEDPYFYYYADEMGFLTWCEMPSAYNFCVDEVADITAEWQAIINTARAFASVVCYVPLNESWGVRKILTDGMQQSFAAALYYLTKAIDPSRIISANDGWENVEASDIIGIHDYAYDSRDFLDKYRAENFDSMYPQGRKLMCCGNSYGGQPALLTEFGGIAISADTKDGNWGYGKGASDIEELYARLENLMQGIKSCPFQGYCYTQLTDVQQEVNGLLDADHKPKADFARLAEIFKIK